MKRTRVQRMSPKRRREQALYDRAAIVIKHYFDIVEARARARVPEYSASQKAK